MTKNHRERRHHPDVRLAARRGLGHRDQPGDALQHQAELGGGHFIGYNTLCIPIAAGVLYPFTGMLLSPMIAGAAMSLSSITVVSNANRLRLFKPHNEKGPA